MKPDRSEVLDSTRSVGSFLFFSSGRSPALRDDEGEERVLAWAPRSSLSGESGDLQVGFLIWCCCELAS
jgi:hypothetical protein